MVATNIGSSMWLDLAWTIGGLIGMVGAFMDGRYLATFVWFGIAMYAFSNFVERKLKGSKYDY